MKKLISLFVGMVMVLMVGSNVLAIEKNPSMAYVMMKDYVRSSLKSPSSGKFPSMWKHSYKEFTTYIGGYKYRITSWVDAQNGFGAMIRIYYTGEIKQVSQNRWRLIKLEFVK